MAYCNFCGNDTAGEKGLCSYCSYWPSHMIVSRAELPLDRDPFVLDQNHFEYKNIKYSHKEICHIDFDYLNTKTHLGLMQIWDSDKAELVIHMINGVVISEKKSGTRILTKRLENLYSVKDYLSSISFVTRFNQYAKNIKSENYFNYDGYKFFTDGTIETRNKNKTSLSECRINNYGTFIELIPENSGLINKIGRGLLATSINSAQYKKKIHSDSIIHITRDNDVFRSLMLRLYNIKL